MSFSNPETPQTAYSYYESETREPVLAASMFSNHHQKLKKPTSAEYAFTYAALAGFLISTAGLIDIANSPMSSSGHAMLGRHVLFAGIVIVVGSAILAFAAKTLRRYEPFFTSRADFPTTYHDLTNEPSLAEKARGQLRGASVVSLMISATLVSIEGYKVIVQGASFSQTLVGQNMILGSIMALVTAALSLLIPAMDYAGAQNHLVPPKSPSTMASPAVLKSDVSEEKTTPINPTPTPFSFFAQKAIPSAECVLGVVGIDVAANGVLFQKLSIIGLGAALAFTGLIVHMFQLAKEEYMQQKNQHPAQPNNLRRAGLSIAAVGAGMEAVTGGIQITNGTFPSGFTPNLIALIAAASLIVVGLGMALASRTPEKEIPQSPISASSSS